MRIARTADVDLRGMKSVLRAPWPEMESAMARLQEGEGIELSASEWKKRYNDKTHKHPMVALKGRLHKIASECGKKVRLHWAPITLDCYIERID